MADTKLTTAQTRALALLASTAPGCDGARRISEGAKVVADGRAIPVAARTAQALADAGLAEITWTDTSYYTKRSYGYHLNPRREWTLTAK